MRTRIIIFFIILLQQRILAQNIQFLGNLDYPEILSNIWGYTAPNGSEYALVGTELGLSIVDVSIPSNPVQLHFIKGDTSLWREPKTWDHYAYATNEKGGGLMIVNLEFLPDSIEYSFWQGDSSLGNNLKTAHTCFIDEKGFIYINGSNLLNRGSIICDLKPDPMAPVTVGIYDDFYVHDCFAVRDTLYTGEIRDGQFSVIDVRNRSNPVVLSRQRTPFTFTHNTWLSEDGSTLFTTDEKSYATVASYDVRDINNISLLDEYRTSTFDSLIPHNVHYKEGYIFTSYYRNGITICDASRPSNLIETGSFDTSPFPAGNGFEGCWGVYPYFPSGNIVCSDRETGLYVLRPELKKACYLEGKITNAAGNGLPGIVVEVMGIPRWKESKFNGNYATGAADSGLYTVRFYDPDNRCALHYETGVLLEPGRVTNLNVSLLCNTLSTQNNELDTDLIVYPSPCGQNCLIRYKAGQERAVIDIIGADGRQIQSFEVPEGEGTISVANGLPAGLYTISMESPHFRRTVRFIKSPGLD
jgi:choice-of-anchor B domain-containing protein